MSGCVWIYVSWHAWIMGTCVLILLTHAQWSYIQCTHEQSHAGWVIFTITDTCLVHAPWQTRNTHTHTHTHTHTLTNTADGAFKGFVHVEFKISEVRSQTKNSRLKRIKLWTPQRRVRSKTYEFIGRLCAIKHPQGILYANLPNEVDRSLLTMWYFQLVLTGVV
jgi:hypothetical protein